MFNSVGLIAKSGDERVVTTLRKLVAYLHARQIEIRLDAQSAECLPDFALPVATRAALGAQCDLVMVVAGDGTFLDAARSLVDYQVPLLGINLGRLGFLADIMPSEMTGTLDEIFDGQFEEESRFLLDVAIHRDHKPVFRGTALNEVVVHKWNIARLIEFETYVDTQLVHSQRSDGLIVATPTGSTAYALSGGGPILHASLDAIVLVPICPHTLSSRPLVVRGNSRIEVLMGKSDTPEAQLTCDGQTIAELATGDRIAINKKAQPLRLIHPKQHDYYATLRAKLHWSKGV